MAAASSAAGTGHTCRSPEQCTWHIQRPSQCADPLLQVDATSLFDPYDRHVRHAPDIVSTATSPTVSVSISPKDSLSIGGAQHQQVPSWRNTSWGKVAWVEATHLVSWLRSANGDQAWCRRQQLCGGLPPHPDAGRLAGGPHHAGCAQSGHC